MCSRIPPSTVLTFEVLLSSQRGWLTQLSKYWLREILGWQLLKLFLLCLGSPKTRSAPQIGPKTVGSSCPKSYPRALVPKSADCCGVRCTQQIRVTKTQNQNKSAASLGQPSDLFTLTQRGWGGSKNKPPFICSSWQKKSWGLIIAAGAAQVWKIWIWCTNWSYSRIVRWFWNDRWSLEVGPWGDDHKLAPSPGFWRRSRDYSWANWANRHRWSRASRVTWDFEGSAKLSMMTLNKSCSVGFEKSKNFGYHPSST